MRKTVQKPAIVKPVPGHTHSPHITAATSAISEHKVARAKAVPKSSLVKRFSDMAPAAAKSVASLASRDTPSRAPASSTSRTSHLAAKIDSAVSHEQPKIRHAKLHARVAKRLNVSAKLISMSSFALAALLIGGFFAYQNIPNLSMRLASARAGVHGSLPAYKPAGFSLHGGISYKPGQITIGYKANSDDRSFTITQIASSWNSETLVQNYDALKNNASYVIIPNKGKTIYLYNGSNATWVDGGIWYRIEGNSQLNSDQLLNLANSM